MFGIVLLYLVCKFVVRVAAKFKVLARQEVQARARTIPSYHQDTHVVDCAIVDAFERFLHGTSAVDELAIEAMVFTHIVIAITYK